ncbi:klarsicht protein-like isoform X2 [Uranotaenia lowii]|uniref:klarsicht protein-like isoform X2 n=1 Tax=Uranotaenia lowii TaxID=190385 RepID=UPI0024798E80|nr:klarsicht protein-like isoform X2 [Uranotaenia lowii]
MAKRVRYDEIYREIESNSRAVAACVRAYEKKSAKAAKYSGSVSGVNSVASSSSANTTPTATGSAPNSGPPSGSGSLTPEVPQDLQNPPGGCSEFYQPPAAVRGTGYRQQQQPRSGSSVLPGGCALKPKENSVIKSLERRYYLLYLKAYEIRCLLEGLLDSKTSSSDNNASLSDTDEEPVNKLARLSCSKSLPGSSPSFQHGCLSGEEWAKSKKCSNAGFDADSEGSDCEVIKPNIINYQIQLHPHHLQHDQQEHHQHQFQGPGSSSSISIGSTRASTTAAAAARRSLPAEATTENPDQTFLSSMPEAVATAIVAADPAMEPSDLLDISTATITSGGTDQTDTSASAAISPLALVDTVKKLSGADIIDGIIREGTVAQDLINNNSNGNLTTGTETLATVVGKKTSPQNKKVNKRSKPNDLSKFTRSTRKSKSCAIFYFKHLDTDSEQNKDSSERTKSEESSPEGGSSSSEGDEGWVYNNGDGSDDLDPNQNPEDVVEDEEDEKENKPDGEDRQDGLKMVKSVSIGTNSVGVGGGSLRELKSKKCLDFSGVDLSSRALMMTSIGAYRNSTESVENGDPRQHYASKHQQYATTAIQRLVLNAETLVRDEIFAKSPNKSGGASKTTQSSNVGTPQYLHHNHHHHHHHYHQQQQQHQRHQKKLIVVHPSASSSSPNNNSSANNNGSPNFSSCGMNNSIAGNRKSPEKGMSNVKINRIEEWLEKQPLDVAPAGPHLSGSVPTTDCEASGEYTDSDSITRDTDSSEGLANSVATCLQGDQTSQELLNVYPSEHSNISNDEVESKNASHSNSNSSLVKRRLNKSSAERPWSVSCISQLNTSAIEINQYIAGEAHHHQKLTACFSISESALNTMSSALRGGGGSLKQQTAKSALAGCGGAGGSSSGGSSQQQLTAVARSSDGKGSLKKRKLRARRKNRIDESGSDESQPPSQHSSALQRLQHSLILQHQKQLLHQQHNPQHQQPLREIQLAAAAAAAVASGSGSSASGRRLLKSESFSGRIRLADELVTLSSLSGSSGSRKSSSARQTTRGTTLTTCTTTTVATTMTTAPPATGNGNGALKMRRKSGSPDSEEDEHQHQQQLLVMGGEDDADFGMARPNFKIGSITRARYGSLNLGSLAALANYNLDANRDGGAGNAAAAGTSATTSASAGTADGAGTGTEEMSSFSEQAWDNYQDKYSSEPYSEDRDTDAARRLLYFGDDYRNFIDSQSDCASSSLSAANMDSLSPPRFRRNDHSGLGSSGGSGGKGLSPESNLILVNRRKRLDEYRMDDRYSHNMHSWSSKSGSPPHHHLLDKTLTGSGGGRSGKQLLHQHQILYESPLDGSTPMGAGAGTSGAGRRRSLRSVDKHNSFLRSLSHETSSSSNNEFDEDMEAEVKKLLITTKLRFANTEALKSKSHLLKPEDYEEIIKTCRDNVRCLETVLMSQPGTVLTAAKCQDLRDTILCWERLLSWSERRQITTRFQADIQTLKDGLEELGSKAFDFTSEEHIQLAIDQLKLERKVLQDQRPKMLTLNAAVHKWISVQELERKELLEDTEGSVAGGYSSIDQRLEQLDRDKNFAKCIDQKCGTCYECLTEMREDNHIHRELKDGISALYSTWDETEVRIRTKIENLSSSLLTWKQLEDGLSDFRNILNRDRGKLQGIEGALQSGAGRTDEIVNSVKEVVKALSEKAEPLFQEHNVSIPINLKLSSSGSLSDSGISDGGGMSDGSLSEREKRLSALKRLVKQLEVALVPGSEAMQTITKRLEMAEHDLRSLQNTCRKIIMSEKGQNGGLDVSGLDIEGTNEGESSSNNNDSNVKNKNRKGKKNRTYSPSKLAGSAVEETDSEETRLDQEVQTDAVSDEDEQGSLVVHDGDHVVQPGVQPHQLGLIQTTKLKLAQNRWVWRITKIALPVQLALVLVMCAACFFEPHCCDALNTYSMSFTPQLRYIKGPPPV